VRLGLPLGNWRGVLQGLGLRGGVCCVDYRPEIHDVRLVDITIYCLWSDRALVTIPMPLCANRFARQLLFPHPDRCGVVTIA
jgi:hypothetical protein